MRCRLAAEVLPAAPLAASTARSLHSNLHQRNFSRDFRSAGGPQGHMDANRTRSLAEQITKTLPRLRTNWQDLHISLRADLTFMVAVCS
jgi:predicted deacylase